MGHQWENYLTINEWPQLVGNYITWLHYALDYYLLSALAIFTNHWIHYFSPLSLISPLLVTLSSFVLYSSQIFHTIFPDSEHIETPLLLSSWRNPLFHSREITCFLILILNTRTVRSTVFEYLCVCKRDGKNYLWRNRKVTYL